MPVGGKSGLTDDESTASVVVHDVQSDRIEPQWKGMTRAQTESEQSTMGPRTRAQIPARPPLRFSVSTQVTLPANSTEAAFKHMADSMVVEVEAELEMVTSQRDSMSRELSWYKQELADTHEQLKSAQMELQRLRVAGSRPDSNVPPAWWAAAKADLLRSIQSPGS